MDGAPEDRGTGWGNSQARGCGVTARSTQTCFQDLSGHRPWDADHGIPPTTLLGRQTLPSHLTDEETDVMPSAYSTPRLEGQARQTAPGSELTTAPHGPSAGKTGTRNSGTSAHGASSRPSPCGARPTAAPRPPPPTSGFSWLGGRSSFLLLLA